MSQGEEIPRMKLGGVYLLPMASAPDQIALCIGTAYNKGWVRCLFEDGRIYAIPTHLQTDKNRIIYEPLP